MHNPSRTWYQVDILLVTANERCRNGLRAGSIGGNRAADKNAYPEKNVTK